MYGTVALTELYVLQSWLLFQRPKAVRPLGLGPHASTYQVQSLHLQRPDGATLAGWVAYPDRAPVRPRIVLYLGGRSEDVRWAPDIASYVAGATVYAFNYRGFGDSTGSPSESRIKLDVQAIYFMIKAAHGTCLDDLTIIGRSLGCAFAVWLARDAKPRRLALFSPFTDLHSVLLGGCLPGWTAQFNRNPLDAGFHASQLTCDTLVMLAERDDVVPHENSRSLAKMLSASDRVVTIAGTDHRSLPRNKGSQQQLAKFIGDTDG